MSKPCWLSNQTAVVTIISSETGKQLYPFIYDTCVSCPTLSSNSGHILSLTQRSNDILSRNSGLSIDKKARRSEFLGTYIGTIIDDITVPLEPSTQAPPRLSVSKK
jgi:hypothetical protein